MQFRQSSRILLLKLFKSGFVCGTDERYNGRKPWIILRRIRGGRGCGSGSGSTIWERRKRDGIQLRTISKRTIRFRSGIRFEINAVSHSFKSFQQIAPSHRRHIPARREKLLKRPAVFYVHPSAVSRRKFRILKVKLNGSFNGKTRPPSRSR